MEWNVYLSVESVSEDEAELFGELFRLASFSRIQDRRLDPPRQCFSEEFGSELDSPGYLLEVELPSGLLGASLRSAIFLPTMRLPCWILRKYHTI